MKSHLLAAILLSPLFLYLATAAAQDCASIRDDKARLACHDAASKRQISKPRTPKVISRPQEAPLTPAGKSCVFSASQKLTRLPNLQIIASRASARAVRGSIPNAEYMDVEIDAVAAGQKSTFMFMCITGPQATVTEPLGQR